jgi:hypothetical protein
MMKAVYDACMAANTELPKEVDDFFGFDPPDDAGVKVEIKEHACCKEYEDEGSTGYEIDVTKLPKDVTILRFRYSW